MHGMDKVRRVADHVNMILRYMPYIQTNFVLGMDGDEGPDPFELTKRFIDLAPGAFPGYSLLSSFGEAAPLNMEYQRDGRVIGFPFHFLNNHGAMNLKPLNYTWPEFYDRVIDLTRYSFRSAAIVRRAIATKAPIPRWLNVVRAISSEGYGRIRYYSEVLKRLRTDAPFRAYFEREAEGLPAFYSDRVRKDLGPLWHWLPDGALLHDQNAYLHSQPSGAGVSVEIPRIAANAG